jgi:hypothetical protein
MPKKGSNKTTTPQWWIDSDRKTVRFTLVANGWSALWRLWFKIHGSRTEDGDRLLAHRDFQPTPRDTIVNGVILPISLFPGCRAEDIEQFASSQGLVRASSDLVLLAAMNLPYEEIRRVIGESLIGMHEPLQTFGDNGDWYRFRVNFPGRRPQLTSSYYHPHTSLPLRSGLVFGCSDSA